MTHDELANDLASHLEGNGERMIWCNTQLGPSGSPRPDVFTIAKSFARFAADAYEVKVSVADLRRDTTSGKWMSYRKFAHRVWFAFNADLVPFEAVPVECGIIVRSSAGQWRARRKPVAQVLDTLPHDAWLKLLMHPPRAFVKEPAPRTANEWAIAASLRKRLGKEAADLFDARRRATGVYAQKTIELEESANKLGAEMTRRREYAIANVEQDARRLSQAQQDLAIAIGLEPNAGTESVTTALRMLRWDLERGGLSAAIAVLTRLEKICAREKIVGHERTEVQERGDEAGDAA